MFLGLCTALISHYTALLPVVGVLVFDKPQKGPLLLKLVEVVLGSVVFYPLSLLTMGWIAIPWTMLVFSGTCYKLQQKSQDNKEM